MPWTSRWWEGQKRFEVQVQVSKEVLLTATQPHRLQTQLMLKVVWLQTSVLGERWPEAVVTCSLLLQSQGLVFCHVCDTVDKGELSPSGMVEKSLNAYLLVARTGVPHWIIPGLCGMNVWVFFNLKSSLFFFFLKMQMRMALMSAGFEEQRLPVALGVMTRQTEQVESGAFSRARRESVNLWICGFKKATTHFWQLVFWHWGQLSFYRFEERLMYLHRLVSFGKKHVWNIPEILVAVITLSYL